MVSIKARVVDLAFFLNFLLSLLLGRPVVASLQTTVTLYYSLSL